MDEAVVTAVLDNYQTAPIDERLRATLAYLAKLSAPGANVSQEDIAQMVQAGVSRVGMEEATLIAFTFQILSRLADALDFNLTPEENLSSTGEFLYTFGYKASSLPG